MSTPLGCIGILTSGGDCPGLNAVIRAAARSAERLVYGCVGFLAGLQTLVLATRARATEQAARTVERIGGPRWNVNGDWNPSIEAIERHLRDAHGIDPSGLSLDQSLTMHDNAHNRSGQRHGPGQPRQSSS
jgi:hypothetical protein